MRTSRPPHGCCGQNPTSKAHIRTYEDAGKMVGTLRVQLDYLISPDTCCNHTCSLLPMLPKPKACICPSPTKLILQVKCIRRGGVDQTSHIDWTYDGVVVVHIVRVLLCHTYDFGAWWKQDKCSQPTCQRNKDVMHGTSWQITSLSPLSCS